MNLSLDKLSLFLSVEECMKSSAALFPNIMIIMPLLCCCSFPPFFCSNALSLCIMFIHSWVYDIGSWLLLLCYHVLYSHTPYSPLPVMRNKRRAHEEYEQSCCNFLSLVVVVHETFSTSDTTTHFVSAKNFPLSR